MGRFSVALRPKDGRPPLLAPRLANPLKPTTSDGHFELQAIGPGQYYLLISVPRDLYVRGVKLGGREVLGQPLEFSSQIEGSLTVEVSGQGATFSGSIKDSLGRPAAGAFVILVPPVAFRGDPESYRVGPADIEGRFHLTGIRPGIYQSYAVSKLDDNAWKNPQFMAKFGASAVSVEFKESEDRISDLKLIGQ